MLHLFDELVDAKFIDFAPNYPFIRSHFVNKKGKQFVSLKNSSHDLNNKSKEQLAKKEYAAITEIVKSI